MENSMEVSQKAKNGATIWPSSSAPGYISQKQRHWFEKIHAPQCSWQHYLQLPGYGRNLSVHQQMNGSRCGLCVCVHIHCPGGTSGKEPPRQSGDARDARSIPGSGGSLEEGMAAHSSIHTLCMYEYIYIQCVYVYLHNGILFSHKKN